MAETPQADRTGLFSNILAVAGLLILIAIILWGLFHLGTLSKSWFSSFTSIFSSSKSIKVTVPSNKILSGEEFQISWKYTPKSAGTYAFLYQCRDGFQFKTASADDALIAIPCGIGYTMLSSSNTFSVTPILSGTSSLDVPLSIIFMASAPVTPGQTVSQPQGNAMVTVTSKNVVLPEINLTTETDATKPSSASSEPKSKPVVRSGSPDLSVQILSKGVIEPITGDIISREPTSPNDQEAVRFLISNNSNASTGPWYFTAELPTSPGVYSYISPAQAPLAPGASIENMLRFKNAVPGGIFSVTVDPINEVKESNESNNSASVSI